jgi:xanthine dehydrogenase YagR molybdenum-binding subunit
MAIAELPDIPRVDAFDKVRGATRYAADHTEPGMLHAMLVPARIAKGRLTGIEIAAALGVPGVVRVLTMADMPPPVTPPADPEDGPPPPPPLLIERIAYRGQPIALVLAETLEAAIEGIGAVTATYAEEAFAPRIDSAGGVREATEERSAGDGEAALRLAHAAPQPDRAARRHRSFH